MLATGLAGVEGAGGRVKHGNVREEPVHHAAGVAGRRGLGHQLPADLLPAPHQDHRHALPHLRHHPSHRHAGLW